jgi:hypothetical protein
MGSSWLKPVLLLGLRCSSGTGFSREGVGWHTEKLRVNAMASSRLKPVPLSSTRCSSGTGFSREGVGWHTEK